MPLNTMEDLFVEQLRDVLSAEKQLVKALPKLAQTATSPALAEAFENHLEETREHVQRIEDVFEILGHRPRSKHCSGMEGLIEEGDEACEQDGEGALVDAAIIAAAQRVEHYEIAAYGCLVRYAQLLGLDDAVELLEETLNEEKAADEKLTDVSDSEVMADALASGANADDEDDESETEREESDEPEYEESSAER